MRIVFLAFITVLTAGTSVFGKDSTWSEYFQKIATEYRLELPHEGKSSKLQLHPTPIAKWSQPVRGGDDGSLYLWLHDKRPAAIGAFFIWPNGGSFGLTHEWVSLSDTPIVGEYANRTWNCPAGGVSWKTLDEIVRTTAPTKQKLEMRALARRFQAESLNRDNNREALRLISQPIYEYALDARGLLNGAIFRFAHGTDTEILLLLEPRSLDGKAQWHYALARLSDLKLAVKYDGHDVWSAEFAAFEQHDAHYFCGAHEFLDAPPSLAPAK